MQEKYNTQGKILLNTWAKEHKLNTRKLAERLDMFYQIVWHYIKGARRPNLEMAVRIETVTDHYVPCRSWFQDPLPASKNTKNPKQKQKRSTT